MVHDLTGEWCYVAETFQEVNVGTVGYWGDRCQFLLVDICSDADSKHRHLHIQLRYGLMSLWEYLDIMQGKKVSQQIFAITALNIFFTASLSNRFAKESDY